MKSFKPITNQCHSLGVKDVPASPEGISIV